MYSNRVFAVRKNKYNRSSLYNYTAIYPDEPLYAVTKSLIKHNFTILTILLLSKSLLVSPSFEASKQLFNYITTHSTHGNSPEVGSSSLGQLDSLQLGQRVAEREISNGGFFTTLTESDETKSEEETLFVKETSRFGITEIPDLKEC